MQIQLGKTYVDKITGFTGVATGYVTYISGCNQVLLNPKVDKDGKPREASWIDEQRLTEKKGARIVLDNSGGRGADMEAPKR